jgi:plastocyanin
VRLRRRYVPLIAVLGAATAVLPAMASSETSPTISAYNEEGAYGYSKHSWMPSTATVSPGGVVIFKNPYTTTPHGLKFTGGTAGAPLPSCTGLPAAAETELGAPSWEAKCTFSKAGTYTFVCTVHPEMTGTITVNPNGTTTTTTTTPTTTTTTTPTTPVEPPSGSPLVGGPSLRSSQRGGSVKGSLDISKAGAGDHLEVDLFATTASLAKVKHSTRVRVGRLVRGSVSAGRMSFAVKLNARARNALKRRHRLALTVRIVLTPFYGEPTTLTRSVVEHG